MPTGKDFLIPSHDERMAVQTYTASSWEILGCTCPSSWQCIDPINCVCRSNSFGNAFPWPILDVHRNDQFGTV